MTETGLLFAFLGATGIFLIWSALTHRSTTQLSATGEKVQVHTLPFLDRAFGPFLTNVAHGLARVLRRADKDAEKIMLAGYPPRYRTVYDLYAWKVVAALLFFGIGLINTFIAGPGFLWVALGLGLAGLFAPDFQLNRLIEKRREALRTEMAFTLHRLAIHTAASKTFADAIKTVATETERGGPFIQELRTLNDEINALGTFSDEGLEKLRQRNPHIQEVDTFVEMMRVAKDSGAGYSQTLRQIGNTMMDMITQEIEARGLASSVQMILPIGGLILPAIGIVVIAPGAYLAWQYFLGGG